MTPEQKRWKWVRFDALPDDLKPLISVGAKGHDKEAKEDREDKKKPAAKVEKVGEDSDAEDIIKRD